MFNNKKIKNQECEIQRLHNRVDEMESRLRVAEPYKPITRNRGPSPVGWTGLTLSTPLMDRDISMQEVMDRFNELYDFLGIERKTRTTTTKLEKKKKD